MSVGTWCLTIFSLPLTAVAALSLLAETGMDFEWARTLVVVVGLQPALGSAAYKGVLLSTNAQPGWKDARWMGGYLTNSAILMGCAELLVVSALMRQTQATAILRTALIVLVARQNEIVSSHEVKRRANLSRPVVALWVNQHQIMPGFEAVQ